jgi:S1-C subfamily serine protease
MIVYTAAGKPRLLSAEIDLPGGMLLGGPDGKVVVLALTADSEMRQAGLQPQDEIRAINGQPVPATLEAFARFYEEITNEARKTGASYTTQVWRPSQSSLVGFTVGAPPSIPSMF